MSTEDGLRGERGAQGAQGERGAAGLSRAVRRALVALGALPLVLFGLNLLWQAHQSDVNRAQFHAQQAAQQRAAAAIEAKICTGFAELAALTPPPGDPATNPSRAFDDREHTVLVGIGSDVGCRR